MMTMARHLFEHRYLLGQRFLSLGELSEWPDDGEQALLADLLERLSVSHGAWAPPARAPSYVLMGTPIVGGGPERATVHRYESVGRPRGLLRVDNPRDVRELLSESWREMRLLVICAANLSAIDTESLAELERTVEVPNPKLLAAASFIALRWFHATQIDFYSSVLSPAALEACIRETYEEHPRFELVEVTEHF